MTRLVINDPSDSLMHMLVSMGYTFDTEEAPDTTTVTAVPQHTDVVSKPAHVRHFDNFPDLLRASGLSQSALSREVGCSLRTVQAWCVSEESKSHRGCAQYILDMMSYYLGL